MTLYSKERLNNALVAVTSRESLGLWTSVCSIVCVCIDFLCFPWWLSDQILDWISLVESRCVLFMYTESVLRTIVATLKGIPGQASLVESRYILFLYTESVLFTVDMFCVIRCLEIIMWASVCHRVFSFAYGFVLDTIWRKEKMCTWGYNYMCS